MSHEHSPDPEVPWSLVDLIPPPNEAQCRQLARLLFENGATSKRQRK